MAQEGILQLARMELHDHVELTAIWRDGGGIEYWLRHESGAMMQVSAMDAVAISNARAHGQWWRSKGMT